jgi:hypothetical protein
MTWLTNLLTFMSTYTDIYSWKDVAEIFVFTGALYTFMRWIAQDTQKNLIAYFYAYSALLIGTYYTGLTLVSELLILAAPVTICIFIIVHQHTLQKNFVTLKKIIPAHAESHDWIDELVRTSLHAMNKGKTLVWAIERKDNLATALEASCLFYADIKQELIATLLESPTVADECILWIAEQGKLVTCNAKWAHAEQTWISPDAHHLPAWQQHALLVSAKTDTIIVHSDRESRLFTVVSQAKSVEHISAHQATVLLKRLITNQPTFQEGVDHAHHTGAHPLDQQHPEN